VSARTAWILGYITAFNQYGSKPQGDVSGGKDTEMIEKFYAAHIKNTLDAAAINVMRPRRAGRPANPKSSTTTCPYSPESLSNARGAARPPQTATRSCTASGIGLESSLKGAAGPFFLAGRLAARFFAPPGGAHRGLGAQTMS
jgi:hypothetical protein